VPRRSLALVAAQSLAWLAISQILHLGLTPLMLLATGCFTVVYVLGTAAAVRLLPRASRVRRVAMVAFVSVVGLLVLGGVHVVWALGVVATSLTYQWLRDRGRRRSLMAGSGHGNETDRQAGGDTGASGDVLQRS
jgi:amino acid efflux transporter